MTSWLHALSVDAHDPIGLAGFWSRLLGWAPVPDVGAAVALRPDDETTFWLRFTPGALPKTSQNRMHLDLTSTSLEHQRATVARALALGAHHADVGQGPDEPHVVLADPEGNEFCVLEPGNAFLADCGFVGALACDGSRAVGCFWSEALGWPLVWEQDEETAIRSPRGGPKITWGGPPVSARTARDRLRLELVVAGSEDLAVETERLTDLGATLLHGAAGTSAVLADPDGNEFHLRNERPGAGGSSTNG